ncbi:hypothetical protein B9N43_01400 [Denitratisoma sp. DHT3]|uniref:response regulator n=1 Tax=Denitratisoma sp. DHT3 TaxID=1981880 RepID=UPI001198516C|nr:response regulator [Denitratisoma sp. DHT3]QDX80025.1 hypothetical protein B9N43_01400 [Denitratisoma sp. DHT3]
MDLHDKRGLLIDDIPEMRASVRIQLSNAGLEQCDLVRNVKEAVDKLSLNRYDLVVCDYNLGQGADGQQLLELVRRKKLLPLTTAFMIITGETGYEQVSTAAEFAPDDYLIKPFTAEILGARLIRILEKKAALAPIHRHMADKGNPALALAACDELLAGKSRYSLDILRLKGDLLMELGRHDEALALYESILAQRQTPWGAVGKARALAAKGAHAEAREHLNQILAAYPNYLAAYDSLARLLEQTDKQAAQQVVERALKVSPSTRRQRQLGALALENKDYGRAENAFRLAVTKDRTGFFKSQDDYAGLAKSCAEQGKTQEALTAVKDMAQHFQRSAELEARQAALESQVQIKAGNKTAAEAALKKALQTGQDNALDPQTRLEIAQACFASDNQEEGKRIIQSVAEDHHEDDRVFARAQSVFTSAGLEDEGHVLLEATRKRMIQLNNDAVALARAGELERAVEMLTQAADRLTNNAQVAINAGLALLMQIQKDGMDHDRIALAHRYLVQARHANPDHPKLAETADYYRRLAPVGAPPL